MQVLNIYCGIRSIGWNITENDSVISFGVKRVNVDFDSYYAYIAGQPVAKRIDRRMKRQARRNLWRYKTRRTKLYKLLKEDFDYDGEKFFNRKALNQLRDEACKTKMKPMLLCRVLLDLQAKRGYKSMRGVDDTGDSDYLKTIEHHENALKNFDTVGAYLNSLPTYKNVILRRETYEAEFRRICEVQGLDFDRYYGAIYYQRPLKKGKIAFCRLEQNRKVTHASNPLYQCFRILRDVNNVEIFDLDNNSIDISDSDRRLFIDHLYSGKDLTKAGALKLMGLKKPATYKWFMGKSIAGDFWERLPCSCDSEIWSDLLAATDNTKLAHILYQKGFGSDEIQKLCDFDIKAYGYADYSEKAIKKLLPHLNEGKTLNEAILEVYGKVNLTAGVALRNVVLEQVFASCKSLVEAIKAKHDIAELQIEIDPLLKMGNKARKARASSKRRAEKDNIELNKRIEEVGAKPTDYNRKKLRLWDEMQGVCPYYPDEVIELTELFTDKYNLDHIVPKSKLFDFSEDNLVLCPRELNTKKLRETGRDFVGDCEKYVEFVNAQKISEKKKALLLLKDEDIPTNYISRSAGTDYNTRCFLTLHKNSRCIPNKLVMMYAKSWYGNPYDENDVRNSLVKSFVMANMNDKTIAYFDNIREKTEGKTSAGAYDLKADIALPDLSDIAVYVPKVKYFRKTKFGYISRFSLHKESVYGQRKRHYRNAKGEEKAEIFYKIRQPLGKLTANMVKNISDKGIQRLVAERFEKEGKNFAVSVEENPILFLGKPIKSVSINVNGSALTPLHSAEDGVTGKFARFDRKVDYVYNSMNYQLYIEDGKRKTETLLQAVKSLNDKTFQKKGLSKGDRVIYEGNQYFVSGMSDKVQLRSVYTLLAENALEISKPNEIEKIERQHIPQV